MNHGGRPQGNTKGIHQIYTGWVEGVEKGCFWRNRHLIYSLGQTAVGMRERGGKGGKETNLDKAFPTRETASEQSEEKEAEVWFIGKEP